MPGVATGRRLPDAALAFNAAERIAVLLDIAVMPVWYIGSLVLAAAWAIAGWHHAHAGLVVTAGALLILSVVMSVLLLVPIDNLSKTWTADNRPADWKQQQGRWDRFHYVRVAVIVAAFALLVAALA